MEKSCAKDIIKQYLEKAYWKGADLCPTGTSLDYRSMEIEVENLASEAYVKLSDIDMCGQTAVQAGVKSVKMSPETKMGNREAQLTLEIDSLRRAYYLAYQRAERAEALIYG